MERSYASVGIDMTLKDNREQIKQFRLIQSPLGSYNLAVLEGRVKFHDWSKLSDALTYNISQVHLIKQLAVL